MGSSEGNGVDSFTAASQPSLCEDGCGFFGTAATRGRCSKCYKHLLATEKDPHPTATTAMQPIAPTTALRPNLRVRTRRPENIGSADSGSAEDSPPPVPRASSDRCWSCKKKVRTMGFNCRCGYTYCGSHRHPEEHGCSFDFKGNGRLHIAMANPAVKPDKILRF